MKGKNELWKYNTSWPNPRHKKMKELIYNQSIKKPDGLWEQVLFLSPLVSGKRSIKEQEKQKVKPLAKR